MIVTIILIIVCIYVGWKAKIVYDCWKTCDANKKINEFDGYGAASDLNRTEVISTQENVKTPNT